ncbi:AAA family ATPase [Kineosporia sp. A_224]|uniref:AAA family ATPase n=1 Tax=Kineosporia sp. A_224 TaxID=1962180 RepID=UPI000B4C0647|nr:AAA family ATPase [Kineosporia sp. A_224]
MLVWINGPFGVGKTQTAFELHRRLPGSVVCDPEEIGYGLHRVLPPALRSDFQDLRAWRDGVVETLDLALTRHDGVVLAPMTVTEPTYFAQTVGRLRDLGHDVRHFSLLARREVILDRLTERGLGHLARAVLGRERLLRGESFAVSRLDDALESLRGATFAEHVDTEAGGVREVADRIAASCGLTLLPNTDGRGRGVLQRAAVGLRHVRFF